LAVIPQLQKTWSDRDLATIIAAMTLMALGAVFVSSATFTTSHPLGVRQLMWDLVALGTLALGMLVPYSVWIDYAYIMYGGILAFLVYLPIFGIRTAGSKSWLKLGGFSFQPSEVAKVATILACAAYIRSRTDSKVGGRELLVLGGIVAAPAVLTLLQPDFGTATTFLPIAAACFFLSAFPLGKILKWSALGAAGLAVLLFVAWLTVFKPYQKERVRTYLDPTHDPRGAGYQVNQAKIAVGSGQIWGKGLRSGTQNRLSFLPKPHTDFIFGVVAEETGFLGSVLVLGLFYILLGRFLDTSRLARDAEGRFIAVAGFALILYHVLINVGMVLGVLPTTGIPLPFLSYGGSSLLAMGWLTGLIANVRIRRFGHE
jgi:rod shape determining protein RodA